MDELLGAFGVPTHIAFQQRLRNYLSSGHPHPGVFLAGPDKDVKLRITKNIAKFFLCAKKDTFCGQCSVCHRIEKEIHPDVLIVRDDGEPIKIDTIREIAHQMEVSPIEAAYKFCIVDQCHRMTMAALNAFLKTLEEPPPGRYFWLLTTQVGSMLPTIVSRCLKFTLRPESEEVAMEEAPYEKLWADFLKSGRHSELLRAAKDKELSFITYLQKRLREAVATGTEGKSEEDVCQLLERFDRAVVCEGRLRSNANSGLLLESFLIESFRK